MSIYQTTRRAGPYTGDGSARAFTFGFKVFATTDLSVRTADSADSYTDAEVPVSAYTVTLNADQETAPGGTVTLNAALADGHTLSILSAIPETQPMVLTNRGGFYPETLNDSADRAVALIQQISEQTSRTLRIPATSTITADEALSAVLDTARSAQSSAGLAAAALEEAKALLDTVEQDVTATGDAQVERVTQAGDEQVALVDEAADAARQEVQVGYGVGCSEEVWTASGDTAEGEAVTLPNSMQYVVGRHHLRVAWNGCELMRGVNFAEVGDTDAWSSTITTLMPISTGDELMAWTVPLGRGDTTGVDVRLDSLEDSLADLSRRVVYKDE